MGPNKMKMNHYLSVLDTIWILGLYFRGAPLPNFEFFPTETWDMFEETTTLFTRTLPQSD